MHSFWCRDCDRLLPETEFYIRRARKCGRDERCKPCARAHLKRHRDANREAYRAWQAQHRKNNLERYKECEKAMKALMKQRNPEWRKESYQVFRNDNPVHYWAKAVHNQARIRARRKGVPFAVTTDYVTSLAVERCPVFGIELDYQTKTSKRPMPNSPSLDRIIPEKGYVPGNLIVVAHRANVIKRDATVAELVRLAEFYAQVTGH